MNKNYSIIAVLLVLAGFFVIADSNGKKNKPLRTWTMSLPTSRARLAVPDGTLAAATATMV